MLDPLGDAILGEALRLIDLDEVDLAVLADDPERALGVVDVRDEVDDDRPGVRTRPGVKFTM